MPKRRQKKEVKSKNLEVKILSARKGNKEKKETRQLLATAASQTRVGDEQAEKKKKLIMWIGVSSIMAVFFIAWIFNLKYEFKAIASRSGKTGEFDWSQVKTQLDDTMKQVKQSLAEIKQARSTVLGIKKAARAPYESTAA